MAGIDLKALVGRLNDPCRRALEAAAGLTLARTNYNVEIEHWLLKLADAADGDVAEILRHYEVDRARLTVDLNRALDRMKEAWADLTIASQSRFLAWARDNRKASSIAPAATPPTAIKPGTMAPPSDDELDIPPYLDRRNPRCWMESWHREETERIHAVARQ